MLAVVAVPIMLIVLVVAELAELAAAVMEVVLLDNQEKPILVVVLVDLKEV